MIGLKPLNATRRIALDFNKIETHPVARTKRGIHSGKGSQAIAKRLAKIRAERGITQQEVAKQLGLSQPNVSDYERGTLRLHGELIIELTKILDVSADQILGTNPDKKAKATTPISRRFTRRLPRIEQLPKRDQDALIRTIDAFLGKSA